MRYNYNEYIHVHVRGKECTWVCTRVTNSTLEDLAMKPVKDLGTGGMSVRYNDTGLFHITILNQMLFLGLILSKVVQGLRFHIENFLLLMSHL